MLSIGAIAAKVFGTSNDRRLKTYRPKVEAINALEPELEAPDRRRAASPHRDVPQAARRRRDARRSAGAGLRYRARGGQAHARPAPFRRAADRRHGAAPRQDRRDEDRRRQDAGRHAARLSQRARRRGVHVVTVNDYLAKRDSEWMGRSTSSSASPSASSCTSSTTSSGAPHTPAMSPTAPTTSSASTTCATT